MSAVNAFARADAAWLMVDGCSYHHAGNIMALRPKGQALPRLRLAVATSGRVEASSSADIFKWLDGQPDQHAAIAELPDLLEMLVDYDREAMENGSLNRCGDIPTGMRLTLAWWDADAKRGRAGIISSIDDIPGSTPFQLRQVTTMFSPPLPKDSWPAHSFDPARDAEALADLQRRTPDPSGVCRVAGWFEAIRVHAGGIERKIVRRWPDRIGDIIRPDSSPDSRATDRMEARHLI